MYIKWLQCVLAGLFFRQPCLNIMTKAILVVYNGKGMTPAYLKGGGYTFCGL